MFMSSAAICDVVKSVTILSCANIATKTLVRASGRMYSTLAGLWVLICAVLFFNRRSHVKMPTRELLAMCADQACTILSSVLLGVGAVKY